MNSSKNKLMLNTLKHLNKFNLGDKLEARIRNTLIKVGHCPHVIIDGKCLYCPKKSKR